MRRQRLRSVGGFSLLLLHCLSHIRVKDMTSDSSPAFQRLFFKVHTYIPSVHYSASVGGGGGGVPVNIRSLCAQGHAGMSRSVVSESGELHLLWASFCTQDRETSTGDLQGRLPDARAGAGPHTPDKPGRGPLSQQVRKTNLFCVTFRLTWASPCCVICRY